jgi:FMN-dependent NADH-azoreductase
MGHVAGY